MAVAASCLITLAGLVLYALTKARHQRQVFGRPAEGGRAALLRILAAVVVALGPTPWVAAQGAPMALVTWLFCAVPLVGLAVAGVFTWLDERRRP
jgi:hypothetical protein